MAMNVVFRADASLEIGAGHVARCLTLADELSKKGAECGFVCREFDGHMGGAIEAKGYSYVALPNSSPETVSWQDDSEQTKAIIADQSVDWLIVDNYALDRKWEERFRQQDVKLMVIDDLADRIHSCDLLLDQNLGRDAGVYSDLVPSECTVLAGPRYALLRPQFAEQRDESLKRREHGEIKQLLISMGGVDQPNATAAVLTALRDSNLPLECSISVVMGPSAPWLDNVRQIGTTLPWNVEICVDVQDMAALMAKSDLAIGAGGGTSWERCCMGLPSLVVVIADNQRDGAQALQEAGCGFVLGGIADIGPALSKRVASFGHQRELQRVSRACSEIVDGLGTSRVATLIRKGSGK